MGASMQISLLLCVILSVQKGDTKLLLNYIHICHEDDNECILKSAREAVPEFVKGIPELDVPQMDPFVIDKLAMPLVGLKLAFYNGKVSGFKNCIIDDIDSNMKKRKFFLEFHCNITLKGQYDAMGRLLVFPINGDGDAKIKLTNIRMRVHFNAKKITDDNGEIHFGVKNYKYKLEYGDRVTYNLTNVFKDNKELSDTIVKFINDNWKLVAEQFGQPIVDYGVDLAVKTIERFFLAVPYKELIDGPSNIINN